MSTNLASVKIAGDRVIAELGLSNGPLNLVDRTLLRSLNAALTELEQWSELRCVILHGGTARAFCAGSDIKEFADLRADASEKKILFEDMVLRRLARLPVPTIAALDAPALGGGFELALACDLRVARRGVRMGLTESVLGGLAGNGALRLTRLVGPARAKQMLFTGETVADDEARALGLINDLAHGSALDAARTLARSIALRGPVSNRWAKQLVDAAQDMPLDAGLSLSTVVQQKIFDSRDLHEGVAAFLEKRSPCFAGR